MELKQVIMNNYDDYFSGKELYGDTFSIEEMEQRYMEAFEFVMKK